MPTIKEQILAKAKEKKAKVGIGIIDPLPETIESLKKAQEVMDVVIVGTKVDGFDCVECEREGLEEKQIDMVMSGEVGGMIRGQTDTYTFEDLLAKKGKYDRTTVLNAMILQDGFDRSYFATSGSHAEGWTKKHKLFMVDELIKMAEELDVKPKIGFLTWVRPGSVGRNFFFDQSWEQAEDLIKHYSDKGYEAINYNIEIEKALDDGANMIVFANGTSGNMHVRTLTYCCGINPLAMPQIGIKENISQNSRNFKDYYNLMLFTAARANAQK